MTLWRKTFPSSELLFAARPTCALSISMDQDNSKRAPGTVVAAYLPSHGGREQNLEAKT